MAQDRIPPQNLEAEQSLLGAILIDNEALIRLGDIVHDNDFYKQAHADIFIAIRELSENREPVDLLSLSNRLNEKGRLEAIGGRAYLIQLTSMVPTAAHVVHYGEIVQRKATLRRLMSAGTDIAGMAYQEEEALDTVLDEAERKLFSVTQNYVKTAFTPLSEGLAVAFDRIDELHREKGKLRGVPTGFTDLDSLLGGFQKSDLIILAARPSVGKTSFALDIARQSAMKYRMPVGIFSLEMSKEQLVDRMLSAEAGVDMWRMRTGRLDDRGSGDDNDFTRIGHAMGNLSDAPIYIDDTPNVNIMDIRTKARRLQSEHGLGMLVVDYLQLMESRQGNRNSDNRVNEVAEISRGLKGIARELKIPVLALSQLNRAAENVKPAIPKLSNLRDSGSIEQDADVVIFIYRKAADGNYRRDEIPLDERYIAEIIVAKHRNGPTDTIRLFFDESRVSFRNLDKSGLARAAAAPAQAAESARMRAPEPQF
jgi:replicative DNA helicase